MPDFPPPSDGANISTLDLDVLMTRVRAEVEARKRQQAEEVLQSAKSRITSVNAVGGRKAHDLLKLPDAEFIRESYTVIFGRAPQDRELAELRDRLLTGQITRLNALRELLETKEARQRNARIDGLSRSSFRDGFRRSLPARLLTSVGRGIKTIYMLPRRIQRFLKRVDAIEQMAAETAAKVDLLDQKLADAIKALKGPAA